jgi:hypothetical protein
MEFEDTEDMLFNAADSQGSFDDLWCDYFDNELHGGAVWESDDDLFDIPDAGAPLLQQVLGSPLLGAAEVCAGPYDDMTVGYGGTALTRNGLLTVDADKKLPRDRCHAEACKKKHTLTLRQALGYSPRRSYVRDDRGWSPRG